MIDSSRCLVLLAIETRERGCIANKRAGKGLDDRSESRDSARHGDAFSLATILAASVSRWVPICNLLIEP